MCPVYNHNKSNWKMNEKIKYIFLLILFISLLGCFGQPLTSKKDNGYIKEKSKFDKIFVKHFPDSIETEYSQIVTDESPGSNKVTLYLYEFRVNVKTLDSITKVVKSEHLTSYNWKDSCLLIVHPNETVDPFDEESIDTNMYSSDCLQEKLPIPNFIHKENPDSEQGVSLDSTFDIVVLESKAGKNSQFDMTPLRSMPKVGSVPFITF